MDPFPSFYEPGDSIASPPSGWLWPGWIPRGMLTLLAAAPGAGKSLVALDLARRLLAGLPFPDGAPCACPDPYIVFVDAEGPSHLLQQRARAWDIDPNRLFLMEPEAWSPLDLASSRHMKRLARLIRDLEPCLVIVDSLGAATPGGESCRKALHILLTILPRLAERGNCGLLLIHHLRKRTYARRTADPVSIDDLRGSSHIVAVARSILALSPLPAPFVPGGVPRPSAARRLEVIKSNLAPLPPPLRLLLDSHGLGEPHLRYSGPILTPPPLATQAELCAQWLVDELAAAQGPVRPADLLRAAGQAGFTQATVYRARHLLADQVVELGRNAHDPARCWSLSPNVQAK